ncbi:50S ribosomal protein L6 [bacterium]|jgi:large subunit ribosomal protein L6|nr:50S ribosomal protein L6 [bacterium]MDP6756472.1 50S ribosomal protein L6 [Patescibacteria group bacterium]|tara:strand:- start:2684 stop:3232 length:549 start_codon:yes stop_codon:yes gene_type:complete
MSRVGKQPIELPDGVTSTIDSAVVKVLGPKGELNVAIPPKVKVEQKDKEIHVSVPKPEDSRQAAFWGLARSLISNAVLGVTEGFEKKLEINGVGYKVKLEGKKLVLNVGYSHAVEFDVPEGIEAKVEGNAITINGIDKQLVGETAANIRKIRKPEPYKGKGIKYSDEQIRRKVGKVVKGTEA